MPQDWRTVKVFISSTFRDMQAERDHLVRFVFPRLREELLKRRIHLVDVDLRWGVTSEQDAVAVCEEIIDESRPRFICILGGRYGWTPPGREESITAAEINYAVLQRLDLQEYRFFYFREPQVTAAIPEDAARAGGYREFPTPEEMSEFGPEEAERRAQRRTKKLETLKQEVRDAGFVPFIYPARWDETQQRLVNLKAFGDRIYGDLLASIDDEFGKEIPPELDEFAAENAAMEAFVRERAAGYVVGSRQGLLEELTAFTEGEGPPNVLAVTGPPGSGKSALLARFYLDYLGRQEKTAPPQDLVIPHFIGASPGSTDLRRALRRFCHELARGLGLQEEIPQDLQELLRKFPDLLPQAAAGRRVVLLLDALNQMDAAGNAHAMYWLPYDLPAHVRVIVSSLEHPALQALQRRGEEIVREKKLAPLDEADRRAIVTGFLSRYRKRMTGEQILALLGKEESGNPLYLLTALEELRTLGTYEEITQRIQELPGQASDLFRWIFQRLEQDPGFQDRAGQLLGKELVRGFASLLGVSRYGLSQMELAELLAPGDTQADPPIPPDSQGNVAALLRLLRPYLMHRGELLDFYHGQFRQAAESNYLVQDQDRLTAHRHLADYFKAKADPAGDSTWTGDYPRGLSELPYQQAQAGLWGEFRDTLMSFSFLRAKLLALGVQALIQDYDLSGCPALQAAEDRDEEKEKALDPIQWALRLSAHVLWLDPKQLPSQLTGRLQGFANPLIKSLLDQARRDTEYPWLRPLSTNLTPPGGPLLRTLTGHTDSVFSVGVTQDGRRAVSASSDKTLRVWDLKTGMEIRTLTGHTDVVLRVAFTRDGRRAVSASWDQTLKVWDMETGAIIWTLTGHASKITAMAVTPDGSRVVSASSDKTLRVWDLKTGSEIHTLIGHTFPVGAVLLTPDGRRAISASMDKTLKVWNLETGAEIRTLNGHTREVNVVTSTRDDNHVLSASYDQTLKFWDLETGSAIHTFSGHTSTISAVAVTPDGRRAVSASWDKTLKIWDLETGANIKTLWGHADFIDAVAVTPDGHRIVSASRDNTLKVWDLETGAPIQTLTGHTYHVYDVEVTSDGKWAVSASGDNTLKIWQLGTKREKKVLTGHARKVTAMAVTPDGRQAVSASNDGTLKVWNLETGANIKTLSGHNGYVNAVALLSDGIRAVSASDDRTLKVWDLETGANIRTITGHSGCVTGVAVTPDGRQAVSGSNDCTLKVWNLETGANIRTITGHTDWVTAVAVSPDGRQAVSASRDGTLRVWDMETGLPIRDFSFIIYMTGVAITQDCRQVVSVHERVWELYVWDLETGAKNSTLTGHTHMVSAVAVIPQNRWAVATSYNGTLKVWDLDGGSELACFIADWPLSTCNASPDGVTLVAGGEMGEVYFFRLEGVDPRLPIITAWRSRTQGPRWWPFKADKFEMAFGCPHCRRWSEIPEEALGTELPCPQCGKPLKLNPFTINADWRPVARAWQGRTD